MRFHPFPLESNPHRFVCANIAIKPPDETVIFVRTYHGITPNILLTQYIPSLPAGARLPAFRTLRSAWFFRPLFLLTWHTFGLFHPFCVNKKLKTHLREHSRQSPVPKSRSCFLSEFSGIGRTCFFFFLWFAFFLLFQKKEERNERKNLLHNVS